MSEQRDRLNALLRERGYDTRGDLVIVRPKQSETLEVRWSEHALVAGISTDIGPEFCCDGIRLDRFRKNPVVLWAHDYDGLPIGRSLWERVRSGDSEDDAEKLIAKPQFHLDTELAREVWAIINDAAEIKWELGVIPVEWRFDGDPCVTKWDLVEISAVPSEESAERIRWRIKNLMISSPAILRSVGGQTADKEPTEADKTDKTKSRAPCARNEYSGYIGPYRYDWVGGASRGEETVWTVYGPGLARKVECREDACARVDELNDAWRRGRDHAAGDEPPPAPDGIEERVAKLEKWRRRVKNFAEAYCFMDCP